MLALTVNEIGLCMMEEIMLSTLGLFFLITFALTGKNIGIDALSRLLFSKSLGQRDVKVEYRIDN